jgi:signal transduction histidine kinase
VKSWDKIRSAGWSFASALLAIPLLGLFDLVSGLDLSFSIFYLLPIYWLTWRYGLLPGIFASLLAALAWLSAEILGGQTYQIAWAPYWNMCVRLTLFLSTTILLDKFKSNMERRHLLERLFFHDLLNLTGSLRGFADLLQDNSTPDKLAVTQLLAETTEHIIDEIETQRIISAAENGDLAVKQEYLHTQPFLETLLSIYRHHHCAENRALSLAEPVNNCLLKSDQELLTRILGNLIKNALEATPEAGTVRIDCRDGDGETVFSINNPGEMPLNLQNKVFRDGGTSKGRGRGLGLRSIRLLVDALGGRIDLVSNAIEGTTFFLRLPKAAGSLNSRR